MDSEGGERRYKTDRVVAAASGCLAIALAAEADSLTLNAYS